ncbi:MAG: hypothetical protein HQL21_06350 [Candidatus Omnitrophica bacterium]|nr:hypothetical protein [Candidatus Omnitrophota bacterium]
MKKILAIILVGVLTCAASMAFAEDAAYVASKGGEKYHVATCAVVKKIAKENVVSFAKPEEAVKEGYKPCKTCNPPPSADALVASTGGGKYHKQACSHVAKMDVANKVYYADVAAAEKDGYTSCGVCFKK